MIVKYIKCLVIISPVFLCACTGETNVEKTEDPSQVAAKVDKQEITVHQVQQLIKSSPNQNITANENLHNEVLDQLIKQELLFQQAQKMKLDRDPDALLAIEAAKRKIIVDTYLRKVFESSSTDGVTENDMQEYFDNHPEYFGERKKIVYTQVAVKVPEEIKPDLIQQIEASENIDTLITKLEEQQLPYKHNQQVQTTEKLPKVLIDPLYTLSEGDIGYLTMDDGILVLAVEEKEAMPIAFNEARAAIRNYLYTEKRKEDVEQLVTNLKNAAQIEYVGEFQPLD
jgi:EpsD family peptidyl-prolyl cis-trans isomerase